MAIAYDQGVAPGDLIHRHQVFNRPLERAQRLVIFEIADMLADESLPFHNQRYCVFEISADGKHRAVVTVVSPQLRARSRGHAAESLDRGARADN